MIGVEFLETFLFFVNICLTKINEGFGLGIIRVDVHNFMMCLFLFVLTNLSS